jgi:RNA polymerase sigma-70 factor, ECF subfamily
MEWSSDDIEKLKHRDTNTFTSLYREYRERIYGFLLSKLNFDSDTASDLLHETFASALGSVHTLKNGTNLSGWLYTIAARRFSDYLRKKYNDFKPIDIMECDAPSDIDIENDYLQKEKISIVMSAMDKISDKYRDILVMKHFEGLTGKDISTRLNISEKAVEDLTYRARRALREEMADHLDLFGRVL